MTLERLDRRSDPACGGDGRAATHRVDAAEGLIQDERERVEVGGGAHLVALALLGRHIGERAEHVSGAGQGVVPSEPGAPEVRELRHGRRPTARGGVLDRVVRHEHVLGLDVAVDHALRMRVLERPHERQADLQDLLVGELILGDQPGKRLALDQLGDQVERILVRGRLVQPHDRRVREASRDERLAPRALTVLLAGQRDALERDRAVELLVVSAPHDAEPARAETLDQTVAVEQQLAAASGALVGGSYAGILRRGSGALALGAPGAAVASMDEGLGGLHHLRVRRGHTLSLPLR